MNKMNSINYKLIGQGIGRIEREEVESEDALDQTNGKNANFWKYQ